MKNFLVFLLVFVTPSLFAADQKTFASPEDAIAALKAAVESKDTGALEQIFGADFHDLQTGDAVQDANNRAKFAIILTEGYNPVPEGDDKVVLEVGTNNWPMPIPLMKTNGQWIFDTATGKEEVINRHIGKDELCAIGVCRAFVTAQKQYSSENHHYAQKFKSTPGKKDGLYWPASEGEPASPFGPLVAEAHAAGYGHQGGTGPHPFHGYYFRILTRQGRAAPGGKMNYLTDGELTKGFALVAFPVQWDKSGVMTFTVSQDGQVYQRNFAEKTGRVGWTMKEFNPDSKWTQVQDEGLADAVLEKE